MVSLVKYRAGIQGAEILNAGNTKNNGVKADEYREYRTADTKSWKAQDI
jgi:hypothetical protein